MSACIFVPKNLDLDAKVRELLASCYLEAAFSAVAADLLKLCGEDWLAGQVLEGEGEGEGEANRIQWEVVESMLEYMGNNKKKNRGSRSAGGTPAKLAAAAAAAPSVAEELEGLGAVPTLEGSPEELAAPLMEHYAGRQPAVVAGAAADWKAVATWNFGVLQSLVLSNCPRGEPVDLITYSSDGGYKVNRVADLMEYMELLRQRSITSKGAGKNCPALKRYGIDVPRKAIADSCPVPQVLQDLHASKALKMRDLMGRYFAKVATSGRSVFGLCRHPPLGYGHFIVQ
eukprot:jgi/Tetstr1/424140/TSEL_014748.t1